MVIKTLVSDDPIDIQRKEQELQTKGLRLVVKPLGAKLWRGEYTKTTHRGSETNPEGSVKITLTWVE
jgi:hypothetical protein